MSHSRRIIIRTDQSQPLLHPVEIVWGFTPIDQGRVSNRHTTPIAWKITNFGASTPAEVTITWTPIYGFIASQHSSPTGSLTTSSATTLVAPGQSVTLTSDDNECLSWSAPIPEFNPNAMIAINKTRTPKDIALGIVTEILPLTVEPVLFYLAIPASKALITLPKLMLHAFLNWDYQSSNGCEGLLSDRRGSIENETLDHDVQGTPLLGPEGVDVGTLEAVTYYRLFANPITGAPTLIEEPFTRGGSSAVLPKTPLNKLCGCPIQ